MKTIDGDRLLREIRKHKSRVVVDCKTKYFPLDLIRKIIREAPEVEVKKNSATTNADLVRAMNDDELAEWVITKAPYIGKNYTDSVLGLKGWLRQPAQQEDIQ